MNQRDVEIVSLRNRPVRCAYIVREESGWERVARVIAHKNSWWGGPISPILCESCGRLHREFRGLLRAFDPDFVLADSGVSEMTQTQMQNACSAFEFEEADRAISRPQHIFFQSSVADVPAITKHLDQRLVLPPSNEGGSDWFVAVTRLGLWSEQTVRQVVEATGDRLSVSRIGGGQSHASILEAAERYSGRGWREDDVTTPRQVASHQLKQWIRGFAAPTRLPAVAIIGATVPDFCLYHSFFAAGFPAQWIPLDIDGVDRLRATLTGEHGPAVNAAVRGTNHALRSTQQTQRIYGSASLTLEELEHTDSILLDRLSEFWLEKDWVEGDFVPLDGDTLFGQWGYWVEERGSSTTVVLPVIRDDVAGILPTPLSEHATGDPEAVRWFTEVELRNRRPPARNEVVDLFLPRMIRGNVDARIGTRGTLTYGALPLGYMSDARVEELVRTPALQFPTSDEIIERCLEERGLAMEDTANRRFVESAIDKLGGLGPSAKAIRDPYFRALCKLATDHSSNTPGEHDRGVKISDNEPRYLDSRALSRLQREVHDDTHHRDHDVAALLDRLVCKSVLRRGLVLKCRHCHKSEWYDLATVGQGFTCRRCGHTQVISRDRFSTERLEVVDDIDPPYYYRLDEMVYQWWTQNAWVVVLALDALMSDDASPIFVPEVTVHEDSAKQVVQADFIAVADSRLTLGEAKWPNEVDTEQIEKYDKAATQLDADLAFVTAEEEWSQGTKNALSSLRTRVEDRGLRLHCLTAAELGLSE